MIFTVETKILVNNQVDQWITNNNFFPDNTHVRAVQQEERPSRQSLANYSSGRVAQQRAGPSGLSLANSSSGESKHRYFIKNEAI